jgi:hypothetical protein
MKRAPFAAAILGATLGGIACQGGVAPGATGATLSAAEAEASALPVPKPIASGDYFPAQFFHRAGIIHQYYPVAPGAPLFGDGIWAEPNGMTDFNGFVAQIFQGGTATDSDGKLYIVDVDNRVYVGEYVGTNGERAYGAFCEL